MSEPEEQVLQPREPILEPELEICDAHHHLWDRDDSRYLETDLLTDLGAPAAAGHRHNVLETVFVECMADYRTTGPEALRPVGETEFVVRCAERADARDPGVRVAAAIVGFADLCLGDAVEQVLTAHLEVGAGRFRGIRHAAGWHASDEIRNSHTRPAEGLLAESGFRRGFARLADLGLSFDAWLYHEQIPELTDLARSVPEVPIVLDHCGGPLGIGPYAGHREEVFLQWREAIDDLAACDNVVVKLGGLAMPINGFGWHHRDTPPDSAELAAATAPYVEHCIQRFGVERCFFESNFPVDRVSCSYEVLWNSFKRLAAEYSADEKRALFRDNARRVYRI